jgi:hypothetical protein
MRFSRKALGSDPLQAALIPMESHEPVALFGETSKAPAAAQPAKELLTGQRAQVKAILSDRQWHTIPGLVIELRRRFGCRYMETSVSMRVRELRKRGYNVECVRTKPESNLYQYRATVKAESQAAA